MSVKDGVYCRSSARIAARGCGLGSPKTMGSAMSGKKIAHTTEACHDAWPRQECRHGAAKGSNRCGSTPDTARTDAAVAAEAQGTPHRVCRWGVVAAQ